MIIYRSGRQVFSRKGVIVLIKVRRDFAACGSADDLEVLFSRRFSLSRHDRDRELQAGDYEILARRIGASFKRFTSIRGRRHGLLSDCKVLRV